MQPVTQSVLQSSPCACNDVDKQYVTANSGYTADAHTLFSLKLSWGCIEAVRMTLEISISLKCAEWPGAPVAVTEDY